MCVTLAAPDEVWLGFLSVLVRDSICSIKESVFFFAVGALNVIYFHFYALLGRKDG